MEKNSAEINILIAEKYIEIKEIEKAEIYIQRAKDMTKKYDGMYFAQGRICMFQEDYSDAVFNFKKALLNSPNRFDYMFELAEAHFKNNNIPKAKKYFQLCAKFNPSFASELA